MRFFENGPAIPDLLLERRDAGRVVFFCGAGVSLKAGMPDFLKLTTEVVEYFDPPPDSEILTALHGTGASAVSLDQVFNLLQREYGRSEVNEVVTDQLTVRGSDPDGPIEHKVISRISSNRKGEVQLVTTNFDLLFEAEHKTSKLRVHTPPGLPDLALGMPIAGLTYLHGRLNYGGENDYPYVLSSSDFGRAYLAEGWATKFVRSLLSSYTVVLLGYSAEDPPMRYLLQGLNHDGRSDRSNLYAFDRGEPEEIETKWRDHGVTPIAFREFPDLWETLGAWAARAENPRNWRKTLIDKAADDPKILTPHQRGQIAHIVRTSAGAKLLSVADPPVHPEWINVFDAACRTAKSSRDFGSPSPSFSPLDNYGLDDDPPLPTDSRAGRTPVYENLLHWNRRDSTPTDGHRITGRPVRGYERIPPRLWHLVLWIGKNLNHPSMAWWAARQNGLHPRLVDHLRWCLRCSESLPSKAVFTWNSILECQSAGPRHDRDIDCYDFKGRVDREGWGPSILRQFALLSKPRIVFSQPYGESQARPPSSTWEDVRLDQISRFDVEFTDRCGAEVDVPDSELKSVLAVLQSNLQVAAGMLTEYGSSYYRTPTCYPERDVDGDDHHREFTSEVRWFLDLFCRMASLDAKYAAGVAATWSIGEPYFFRNLKLFALNQPHLFAAHEALAALQDLNREEFWDINNTRELLFLIADRWNEFPQEDRVCISNRILEGPPKPEHLSDDKYPNFRAEFVARYGCWLLKNGGSFPTDQKDALNSVVASLPDWNDAWAGTTTTELNGRSGWVVTDESPDALRDVPVGEIVDMTQEHSTRDFREFVERRPFSGLVKSHPRKALAALSIKAKLHEYPVELWSSLVQNWPENASDRLTKVFVLRLVALPAEVLRDLRHTLSSWLRDSLPQLHQKDPGLAWKVFDDCVSAWMSGDSEAADSTLLGKVFADGEPVEQSRRTFGHAINSPIGHATEGIVHTIDRLKLADGHGLSPEFSDRFVALLASPGEGPDHAISILARHLSWLNRIDPHWVASKIIPLFDLRQSMAEPAWNGLLHSSNPPSEPVRTALREQFVSLFPQVDRYQWDRDLAGVAGQWIAWMGMFLRDKPSGLSAKEVRASLRTMKDETRHSVISWLGKVGKDNENGWIELVNPFVSDVWPKERTFRTSGSVKAWLGVLDDTGEDFPAVYSCIKRFLVPIEEAQYWLHQFTRDIGGDECLTKLHPEPVLDLMDVITSDSVENLSSELPQVLELIEESDESLVDDPRFVRLTDLVENA